MLPRAVEFQGSARLDLLSDWPEGTTEGARHLRLDEGPAGLARPSRRETA